MQVLAIETSEKIGTIAALTASDDSVMTLHEATLPADQRSAQSLVPEVKSLLSRCHWKPQEVDLIAVSTGPGSFTGLRIGVTTAKTLAYATGAELVEVHTLSAIAAAVQSTYRRLWTILDAQRNELFVACYKQNWQNESWRLPETSVVPVERWVEQLQPEDLVCGPPLARIADRLPAGVAAVEPGGWKPYAATVGQLGVAAHRNGQSFDAMQLVPRYYRKSAAEEKADAAKQ